MSFLSSLAAVSAKAPTVKVAPTLPAIHDLNEGDRAKLAGHLAGMAVILAAVYKDVAPMATPFNAANPANVDDLLTRAACVVAHSALSRRAARAATLKEAVDKVATMATDLVRLDNDRKAAFAATLTEDQKAFYGADPRLALETDVKIGLASIRRGLSADFADIRDTDLVQELMGAGFTVNVPAAPRGAKPKDPTKAAEQARACEPYLSVKVAPSTPIVNVPAMVAANNAAKEEAKEAAKAAKGKPVATA